MVILGHPEIGFTEALNKYVNSGIATVFLGSKEIIHFTAVFKVATSVITWQNSGEMPSSSNWCPVLPYGGGK